MTRLLPFAWVLFGGTLAYAWTMLELEHNVLDWHPQGFSDQTAEVCAIYSMALLAAAVMSRYTRSKFATTSMWAVLLLAAVLGVVELRPEHSSDPVKPRTKPSPLWYRSAQGAALIAPAVAVWITRRRMKAT